jgi:hypothetical protein
LIKLKRDVQPKLRFCDARSLERLAGLEPVVTSLEDSHSTFELQPPILERATGVGPASPRWQRGILPLKYARQSGGDEESRTPTSCLQGKCAPVITTSPKTWYPVQVASLGPSACRAAAPHASELTGHNLWCERGDLNSHLSA